MKPITEQERDKLALEVVAQYTAFLNDYDDIHASNIKSILYRKSRQDKVRVLIKASLKAKWFKGSQISIRQYCPFCVAAIRETQTMCPNCICPKDICAREASKGIIRDLPTGKVSDLIDETLDEVIKLFKKYL